MVENCEGLSPGLYSLLVCMGFVPAGNLKHNMSCLLKRLFGSGSSALCLLRLALGGAV